MYDARKIANYFLKLAKRDGKNLDPMKLQKLVYLAHGWYLATTGKPLITQPVRAWRYGPVILSIYEAFKRYGNGCIEEPATDFDFPRDSWFSSGWLNEKTLSIKDTENAKDPQFTLSLLERVWKSYGHFSGIQLSNLTHNAGTPWDIVWNHQTANTRGSAVISNEIIRTISSSSRVNMSHQNDEPKVTLRA